MSADRPSTEPAIEFEGPYQGQAGPYFGDYGGQWMPESLVAALQELTRLAVYSSTGERSPLRNASTSETISSVTVSGVVVIASA